MEEQLFLAGMPKPPPPKRLPTPRQPSRSEEFFGPDEPTDRLFLALFPDGETAHGISGLASRLRTKHGLSGNLIATCRLHVTLIGLGDYRGLPPALVELARIAAARAAAAVRPFEVSFRCAGSFRNRRLKKPFVLTNTDESSALNGLHARLVSAMEELGIRVLNAAGFNPHVTMTYDEKVVPEEPVETVCWKANEVVLVHSLLGKTCHIPLGRWKLNGRTKP